VAEGRRKFRKSDANALQIQALWKEAFNCYKRTLHQIEKSQEVVATAHALLNKMQENERHQITQTVENQVKS